MNVTVKVLAPSFLASCELLRRRTASGIPARLVDRSSGRQLWIITDEIAATSTHHHRALAERPLTVRGGLRLARRFLDDVRVEQISTDHNRRVGQGRIAPS